MVIQEKGTIKFPDQLLQELLTRELFQNGNKNGRSLATSKVEKTVYMIGTGDPESEISSMAKFWTRNAKSTAEESILPSIVVPIYLWATGLDRTIPKANYSSWPMASKMAFNYTNKALKELEKTNPGHSRLERVEIFLKERKISGKFNILNFRNI